MGILLIVIVIILIVLISVPLGVYNSLVRKRNVYKNAFSQIDVQLKRRYDLIPNLVETAKGYLKHESSTLEAVTKARNLAVQAIQAVGTSQGGGDVINKLAQAESVLTGALKSLFAVAESYPDLKANQNMMQLAEELSSTENRVSFARQAYNDDVMTYNTARETFPGVLFAGAFGFREAELFVIPSEEERQAPKVSF